MDCLASGIQGQMLMETNEKIKGAVMSQEDMIKECADPDKESITIALPCEMAARVQKLAQENNTTLSSILIEALDEFLRRRK